MGNTIFLTMIPAIEMLKGVTKGEGPMSWMKSIIIDNQGNKQGIWSKSYTNGSIRYRGQFKDNIPYGIFNYYYVTGELEAKKEFFHNGLAAATHIFYQDGALKVSGLYANDLKDSTWNYYNNDSIMIMSEQYEKGKLNGITKTFYYDGSIYEIKHWENDIENGKWVQYFINGEIKMKASYKEGLRSGQVIYFFLQ